MDDFKRLIDVLEGGEKIESIVESIYRYGIWGRSFQSTTTLLTPTTIYFLEAGRKDWSSGILDVLDLLAQYESECDDWVHGREAAHGIFVLSHPEIENYGWPVNKLPNFMEINEEINPKLVTLYSLIFGAHKHIFVSYQELAWEIERNGVYGYDSIPKKYIKHSPDSRSVDHALMGLSVYYDISISDWPDCEREPFGYDPDDDPTCRYGWPNGELPEFKPPNDEERPDWLDCFHRLKSEFRTAFFKTDLFTVGRILIFNKATPAQLLNAIEKYGIHGYDKVGRLKFDKPTEIQDVFHSVSLDLIPAVEKYSEPFLLKGRYNLDALQNESFAKYGWPRDKLPDFKAIENNSSSASEEQDIDTSASSSIKPAIQFRSASAEESISTSSDDLSPQSKKGYDLLVLGLLAFINGEFTPQRDSDPYTKQDDLAKLLKDRIDAHSMSIVSIKTKFGAANALRNTVNLKPLKDVSKTAHLKTIHKQLESSPKPLYGISDEIHQESPDPKSISGSTF